MEQEQNKQEELAKQRQYQANYFKRHKAARTRLGLTIAQFNKLPRATRMMEMKHPGSVSSKAKRNRERQRQWYRKNKTSKAIAPSNSESGTNKDRIISFCRDLLAIAQTL